MNYSKCIYDEKDKMTFDDVYKKHRDELPMLALIIDGHYGVTDLEDLSNFQIVWIHCYTTQKRFLAKQNLQPNGERWISIPLSTKYNFKQVNKSSQVSPTSLQELLEKEKLPLDVVFDSSTIKIGYVDQPAKHFQPLTITQEYNEHFLHCFEVIISDSLDSLDTNERLVATSVNMACTRINGLRGKNADEFHTFLTQLQKQANLKTSDTTAGFQEITQIRWPNSGTGNQLPHDLWRVINCCDQEEEDVQVETEYLVLEESCLEGHISQKQPPPLPVRRYSPEMEGFQIVPDLPKSNKPTSYFRRSSIPAIKPPAVPPRPKSIHEKNVVCGNQWLTKMTISEVSDALNTLNLGKFVKEFKDDCIDGTILSEVTDAMLERDYKFRAVEIIRLRKYIDSGHIPK